MGKCPLPSVWAISNRGHASCSRYRSDINGIEYESDLKRLVITSWSSTWVMAVNESDKSWKWWDAGWHVRGVRSNGGRLLAASLYNGVVVQPQTSAGKQIAGIAKQDIGAGGAH